MNHDIKSLSANAIVWLCNEGKLAFRDLQAERARRHTMGAGWEMRVEGRIDQISSVELAEWLLIGRITDEQHDAELARRRVRQSPLDAIGAPRFTTTFISTGDK